MKVQWLKSTVFIASLLSLVAVLYTQPAPASADETHCGTLSSNQTWLASDNVHVVSCDVIVSTGVTLTIEAGAVVKLKDNVNIFVNGKLVAQGSPTDPIYFTSFKDDLVDDTNGDGTLSLPIAGDWGWIEFGATSDETSVIERAEIRYGGERAYVGWFAPIRLINVVPTLEDITFKSNYRNGAEIVPGNWTTHSLDSQTVVYRLWGDTTILPLETLTIASGTKIKADNDARLFINGKLTAVGLPDKPIYMTSNKDDTICGKGWQGENVCDFNNDGTLSLPIAGDWGWIEFGATSDETSVIERAEIRYGGERAYVGWFAPIRLINVVPTLEDITFKSNYRNGAEIVPGNWTTHSLDSQTVVYRLWGDTTILPLETLTIAPGTKIKAEDDARLFINGKLTASGSITQPIYMTSNKDDTICGKGWQGENVCDFNNDGTLSLPAAGDWGWIEFGASSDETSVIERAEIRYGGERAYVGWFAPIRLINVVPTLENITFKSNYRNGAEIVPGNWTSNSWDSTTVIYWLLGDTTILPTEVMTVTPGAKLKMTNDARLFVNGKLVASGFITQPIHMTSDKDDTICGKGWQGENVCDFNNDGTLSLPIAGDWGWIEFGATSDETSVIERAEIRYGGERAYVGWFAPIRLINVVPTLEDITFKSNYRNGAEIVPGNWTTHSLDSQTVVYRLWGDTTILPLETLTIAPGTKIKAEDDARLFINGKLTAVGLPDKPIYMTSNKDDTICGKGWQSENVCDTNNDGALTLPAAENWGWIEFGATSDETSVIERAKIRYGGERAYVGRYGVIRLNGVSPKISHSILELNYRGIEALSGSTPTLTCNDIHNNTNFGIYNNTPATPVTAEGHWWGNPSGPTHATNPGGTGQTVSDGVDFTPWQTASCIMPSLQLTKQVHTSLAKPGDILTYTLTLAETTGNGDVTTHLSDPIPANTSYIPGSARITPAGSGTLTDTSSKIEWRGAVAANSAVALTFQVAVGSLNSDSTVTNVATSDNGYGTLLTRTVATTVDAIPPTTHITAPSNGQIITRATTLIAGLAADATSGIDRVEVSTNNGVSWNLAGHSSPWSYLWLVPTEDGVKHVLKARSLDKVGNLESTSVVTITVDNVPPVSHISNLTNGQVISETTYIIRGTAADGSGITQVELSTDGGTTWQTVIGTTQWAYTWTLPTVAGDHTILVRAIDNSGLVEAAAGGITVNVQPDVAPPASYYTFVPIILK